MNGRCMSPLSLIPALRRRATEVSGVSGAVFNTPLVAGSSHPTTSTMLMSSRNPAQICYWPRESKMGLLWCGAKSASRFLHIMLRSLPSVGIMTALLIPRRLTNTGCRSAPLYWKSERGSCPQMCSDFGSIIVGKSKQSRGHSIGRRSRKGTLIAVRCLNCRCGVRTLFSGLPL